MIIVFISDTHEKHRQLGRLPFGDLLIHAGEDHLTTDESLFFKLNTTSEHIRRYSNHFYINRLRISYTQLYEII